MRKCLLVSLVLIEAATAVTQQPSPQPEVSRHVYIVGEDGVRPPRPKNNVNTEFSPEAREKQINGRCAVSLVVDEQGNPQNIQIIRCTDPAFAQSTLSAVGKYRFWPATKAGKPVAANISVETNFWRDGARDPELPIRYGFNSPPGYISPAPDADGVYPLTKMVVPPTMEHFSDEEYGNAAFPMNGSGACDVVLTIDANGKPSNAQTPHCEKAVLELPAARSLLKSRYKPGSVNGKAVPVRVSVHLELGEFASSK